MKPHPTLGQFFLICAFVSVSARAALAQGLGSDPFVSQLRGAWRGRGTYDGNALSLTRTWTLELGGQFLRADMAVTMPNGASFGARTYWKMSNAGEYDVIWLDGIGRMQTLHAVRDTESGVVSADFIDELAEDGPEARRWEFQATGADSYVERLFRRSGDSRQLLAEWVFERVSGG